jgi:hypothetical protein
MTLEEEEHVQNELASLQREAEAVRKPLWSNLDWAPITPHTIPQKHPPVQLPSVPATQPEVSESRVTIEGQFRRLLTVQRIITSLLEEHAQPQERVALPA